MRKEVALMTQNRKLVESYLNDYNRKDIESMLEHFADDAKFESVSNVSGVIRANNKKELRELASMSLEYFSERRQAVLFWVIDNDRVAIEIDYWCKVAKDLPNGKKTGEEITLRGASFFTIKDGLINRLVDYM
jgi:ketosteroid isomerase-like protein